MVFVLVCVFVLNLVYLNLYAVEMYFDTCVLKLDTYSRSEVCSR